jgi:predicted DNA-binding protein with PD1-like motif
MLGPVVLTDVLLIQGRFELLSLSGSFTPTDNGGTRDRSGGMSVSLAAADGRVIGGGVAGLLVAASPVQVIDQPLLSHRDELNWHCVVFSLILF